MTEPKYKRPLYKLHRSIIARCHMPSGAYLGRFEVCTEWRESFSVFEDWALSNGYEPELQIDRRNNKLGYTPDNCRFVTRSVNCNNKDNNVLVVIFGETKTLTEWSRDPRCAVPEPAFEYRLKAGWSAEEALEIRSGGKRTVFEFEGESKTVVEWSRDVRCVVPYSLLTLRLNRCGWETGRAMFTPSREVKKAA